MPALTYSDFCQRLTMEDILKAAGYRFNRRDGMRYPSYVAVDSQGQRIKGDKFIVMPDRRRCFQPPFQQTYNILSFIRAFPEKFPEYQPGINTNKLINLVCNRLLNTPQDMTQPEDLSGYRTIFDYRPFEFSKYKITTFDLDNWDKMRQFYPYFHARAIDLQTMRAFSRSFLLTSKMSPSGKELVSLSFPLREPSSDEGARILGLELRSRPDKMGKTRFKGLAQGSEATTGLWMATPDTELWKKDLQDKRPFSEKFAGSTAPRNNNILRADIITENTPELTTDDTSELTTENIPASTSENTADHIRDNTHNPNSNLDPNNSSDSKESLESEFILPPLPEKGDIYWFESAYDAMAYYQLNRRKKDFSNAIFVSTSGSPSVRQFEEVMKKFPDCKHHLCFDNDMAGRMFTVNFLLRLKGDSYTARLDKSKDMLVIYDAWKVEPLWHIPMKDFNSRNICQALEIDPSKVVREIPSSGYKDWNDQLIAKAAKKDSPRLQLLQPLEPTLIPKESNEENLSKASEIEPMLKPTEELNSRQGRELSHSQITEQPVNSEEDNFTYRFKL